MNLDHAIQFAAKAHFGQKDKAGEPYILHPLRVMMKFDSDLFRIVAILHDVAEDMNIPVGAIRKLVSLSDQAAEAIDAITRRKDELYTDYIKRCGENPVARKVKIADLLDNFRLDRLSKLTPEQVKTLDRRYRNALEYLKETEYQSRVSNLVEKAITTDNDGDK